MIKQYTKYHTNIWNHEEKTCEKKWFSGQTDRQTVCKLIFPLDFVRRGIIMQWVFIYYCKTQIKPNLASVLIRVSNTKRNMIFTLLLDDFPKHYLDKGEPLVFMYPKLVLCMEICKTFFFFNQIILKLLLLVSSDIRNFPNI